MKLRMHLLSQNMIVLTVTALVTAILTGIYGYIFTVYKNVPLNGNMQISHILVLRDSKIIYKSTDFSSYDLKDILMNVQNERYAYKYKNVEYIIETDKFDNGDLIIQLNPKIDFSKYYTNLIIFVICAFLLVFIIASLIMQRENMKNIITPIIKLKRQTESLREGDLDTEITDDGYGEIGELCGCVERLRLRLRESVYHNNKTDDNRKFLISSISHDLRTPVTAIRGYVEGVLDGVANTDEKKEEYLKKAVEKTILVNVMIEDLLLYSKLDLNQITYNFEKVNVFDYISFVTGDNSIIYENENKHISVNNQLDKDLFIRIDVQRFSRVLQNIFDNARKHINPDGGQVIVSLRETVANVIIEVRDNGVGIEKENLTRIFDRFYRGDNARKIEGSSGLGLAIAKQMVEGMNGRIWATSKVGEGTSMLISIKKYS